jgi:hypothetical protein
MKNVRDEVCHTLRHGVTDLLPLNFFLHENITKYTKWSSDVPYWSSVEAT